MKVRIYSDLHLDYNSRVGTEIKIPEMDSDSDSILFLAGDVGEYSISVVQEVNKLKSRFKQVLWVPGNHEYYRNDIHDVNKFIPDYGSWVIDNTKIIYAVLWTDLDDCDDNAVYNAKVAMYDYRAIKYDGKILTPEDTTQIHDRHLRFIESELKNNTSKNVVVVTHHCPLVGYSTYRGSGDVTPVTYSFGCTDVEYLFYKYKIDYWFYGHTHHPVDTMVNNTRLITNPFGYGNEIKTDPQHKIYEV